MTIREATADQDLPHLNDDGTVWLPPSSGSWLSSKLRRTRIGPVSIEAKRNIRRHILIKSIGKLPCGLQHSSRGAVKRLTPLWWMPRQASNMVLFCTTRQHLLLLNYSIDGGSYFADIRHACFIQWWWKKNNTRRRPGKMLFILFLFSGWGFNRPSEPGVVGRC